MENKPTSPWLEVLSWLCLADLTPLVAIVVLLLTIGMIYLVVKYPIAIFAIACVLLLALYIIDRLCRKKRNSAQKGG